jgi:crotonobetainyl-CoA:carnitine CoA-transferase CaiB-like acyl-CoA transferase
VGPFSNLRVIDLSPHRVGAQISQVFADFGADVIQVEPPGGADIRQHAAYPFWGRGKRSFVLDIHDEADRRTLRDLARHADVFIETHQPGVLDALGLGYGDLGPLNPRLVYTSVTGFGRRGPYRDVPGYEGVVLAALGVFHTFQRMSPFPAPPFVNVPFAAFAASQVAIHGTLAALIERERSGAGQWVETNLLQAFATLDTWAWFEHLIADRWPDAFIKTNPYDSEGRPASPLTFMLLVCLTRDGRWLQFAAVAPHLFAAKMKALGLDWMFADPEWQGLPVFGDDAERRMALWTKMLESARNKTLADWTAIFDADPNVFAEQFRNGPAALEHPQLIHDGFTIDLIDAERGTVRQPAAIVKAAGTPADLTRSAPALDADRDALLALATSEVSPPSAPLGASASTASDLPLAGVTILELATLFAAPHGTTMLTDLGARVIKVEPLAGDRIRNILPFPESGGLKVMQGKDSIAVDLTTPEGVAIIREMAASVDVVVQGYRAGAMAKLGLDYASIKAVNPDVVYVNAPGYGVDGPYGAKPAYAPSIGAASGIPLANVGQTVEERADLTMEQIQDGARRLSAASAMANAQADGFAALGVSTAILFGLAARTFGAGGQELFSSMLNTGCHAMSAQAVAYPGAPREPAPDAELRGLGALYRIYDAADGYVFLAAPTDREWAALAAALAKEVDLAGDARFVDASSRRANTHALIDVLGAVFARKPATEWEAELLATGVACVAVTTTSIEERMFDDAFGRASGYVVDVVHPTLDEHPRLAPYVRFSRSATQAPPAVLNGEQTDRLLGELGRDAAAIADLRARNVVG